MKQTLKIAAITFGIVALLGFMIMTWGEGRETLLFGLKLATSAGLLVSISMLWYLQL